jgi:hypothetical protein
MKTEDPGVLWLDVPMFLAVICGLAAIYALASPAAAFWAGGILMANHLIGTVAYMWMDDDEGRLTAWVERAPGTALFMLAVQLWPLAAWFWLRRAEA